MNELDNRIGDIVTELSAYEVLISCGIPLLVISEMVFNESDALPTDKALRVSDELYILSSILATVANQYESTLKKIIVSLPEDIAGIAVKNPLYRRPNQKDHPF